MDCLKNREVDTIHRICGNGGNEMKRGTLVRHKENLMLYRVVREVQKGFFSWFDPCYEVEPLHPKLQPVKLVFRNSDIDAVVK